MIYTGYFAYTKKYIQAGLVPVSVAGITPVFFTGPKWTPFAPKKELLSKWKQEQINNEEYAKAYLSNLNSSIEESALRNIKKLSKYKNIVLCCYEKPSDFCHRHYLAEWLGNKLGEVIEEYKVC